MSVITEFELVAIAVRCNAARPGPWETDRNNFIRPEMIADDPRIICSEN